MSGAADRPDSPAPAPAPTAADVGIVAALEIEVGYLIDRLEGVRRYSGAAGTVVEGVHADKLVAVIVGGVGRVAARNATTTLLDGHRPRWIVSAGFAGALDPDLRRNDVLLPHEIVVADETGYRVDFTIE
ncbi:MAG: nucleoside phosphorylase, partial [Isosphaeraceae bacterium]